MNKGSRELTVFKTEQEDFDQEAQARLEKLIIETIDGIAELQRGDAMPEDWSPEVISKLKKSTRPDLVKIQSLLLSSSLLKNLVESKRNLAATKVITASKSSMVVVKQTGGYTSLTSKEIEEQASNIERILKTINSKPMLDKQ